MATSNKWVIAHDDADGTPIPLSSPNHNLEGYDARQREIASPSGGTVTAKLLKRPGKHVPMDKGWQKTPNDYATPLASKMGEPVEVKKWTKKNYQNTATELSQHDVPKTDAGKRRKMHLVMSEFASGGLRSGSKKGPKVKSRAQAIAIGLKQSGQSNQ